MMAQEIILDAAGAPLSIEIMDWALARLSKTYAVKRPADIQVRSHPVQMRMYEMLGFEFAEYNNGRVTHNGMRWHMDGGLPLDQLIIETGHTNAVIRKLALC